MMSWVDGKREEDQKPASNAQHGGTRYLIGDGVHDGGCRITGISVPGATEHRVPNAYSIIHTEGDVRGEARGTARPSRLAPGSYSYYFACRGDGDVAFAITSLDAPVDVVLRVTDQLPR